MMANSKLQLYFEEHLIGHLSESNQNKIVFSYDQSWLERQNNFSISHSLPLQEKDFEQEAQNYFANLLPEGDVRLALTRRLGISNENDFRLLEIIGGECAGALSVGPEPLLYTSDYEEISAHKIVSLLEQGQVLLSALQDEEEGIRLSLAGAQDKIPIVYRDSKILLPRGNSPSTHLLKLPSDRVKYLPENECLMNWFAKKMGLETATTTLISLKNMKACLVERYDRIQVGEKISRLHQEDYCQALGFSYKIKYEDDGGPRYQQCYQCTENASSHLPEDLERIVRWLIFNVLIGNCDAHAKNISLLMTAPGVWKLSPHYDLVATKIYPRLSKKLAMSIGGTQDLGTITGTHWSQLAKDIQMGTKLINQTVQKMAETSLDIFDETAKEFSETYGASPVIVRIREVLHTQQRRLLSQAKK
ncbi:MAG: HipA domain-containing protein [Pseudobdellovibrionaceae bacterium]